MEKYFIDGQEVNEAYYFKKLDEQISFLADFNSSQQLLSKVSIHNNLDVSRLEILERLYPNLLKKIILEEYNKIEDYYEQKIKEHKKVFIDDVLFEIEKRVQEERYYINGEKKDLDSFIVNLEKDLNQELIEDFDEYLNRYNNEIIIEHLTYEPSLVLKNINPSVYEEHLKVYCKPKVQDCLNTLRNSEAHLIINGNVYEIILGEKIKNGN